MAKSYTLPLSLSSVRAAILRVAYDVGKPFTTKQAAQLSNFKIDNITGHLNALKNEGKFLKAVKQGGGNLYSLTDYGMFVVENLDKVEITDYMRRTPRTRGPSRIPQAAPEPIINISQTANSLADSLADVFNENAAYRELLMSIHTKIGMALGLNKGE